MPLAYVLIYFDEVVITDLWVQRCHNGGRKLLVKIVPGVLVFKVWVHSRKWGGHGGAPRLRKGCSP